MGLDVYLYRYENRDKTVALENAYETQSEANWPDGEYSSLTEEVKQSVRDANKKLAVSMGLSESGEDSGKECIEFPCTKYPDHYFKIGYFRSSYNGGGINSVLRNLGLPDLYEIMGRDDNDEYIWAPDWNASLVRVNKVIKSLRKKPNLRCFEVSYNELSDPSKIKVTNEESALSLFAEQAEKFGNDSDGHSNLYGHFYPKGLKVFGLIHGTKQTLFNQGLKPSTYVVMEGENEWYVNALEIVQETIEYVLSKPDQEKYFLHWSS